MPNKKNIGRKKQQNVKGKLNDVSANGKNKENDDIKEQRIKELEKEVAILKRKLRLKNIENTYRDNVCKDLTLPNQTQLSIDTDNKRWRRILRDATILSCDEFWFFKPKKHHST
ncbi:518_t:CDS:2 [Entrophospora sp. SA101]|nr:518_t:CDS:2 [Entrophospora sp. SA101]